MAELDEQQRNTRAIVCPNCQSLIFRPKAATWTEVEFDLPFANASAKAVARAAVDSADFPDNERLTHFFKVNDMMAFENIGFTMTVQEGIKYLCCADCETGPLGLQTTNATPAACFVAVKRIKYRE